MSRTDPRARPRLWVVAAAVWLLLLLAWIARLALEASAGSVGCELTPGGSVFGTPSWGWFPPGVTCTYPLPDGRTVVQEPPRLRWGVGAVLLLGALTLATAHTRGHRPHH